MFIFAFATEEEFFIKLEWPIAIGDRKYFVLLSFAQLFFLLKGWGIFLKTEGIFGRV